MLDLASRDKLDKSGIELRRVLCNILFVKEDTLKENPNPKIDGGES